MANTQKRGDSYSIRVSCGYDINGKQIFKTTTWKPEADMTPKQIEKELNRQATLFEERCRNGQVLSGNIKFSEFAEIWFKDYAEKQIRPKTLSIYKELMKRINPAIGHIRLDKLQPHHLYSFYANLEEAGARADTKYKCKIDFKALLRKYELTKIEFSKKAGVSVNTLDSVTQGKNILPKSAECISKALELPIEGLFEPQINKAGLSGKTILHHHRLISAILSTAVEWQAIFSNPCERMKPPRVEYTEAKYLDENQAAEMLRLLEDEEIQYKTIIHLLLYTGMRRGELCGLEWSDIDFDNSVIHIRRSSLYLPEKGIFEDETKNSTSRRSVKASASAMETLRRFKIWQAEERLKIGDQWQDTGKIFTQWNGKPIHPDTLTSWFRKFVTKNNLPPVSIHSLRHTNATLLIAANTNLQTVADRLGHANVATTSKVYAHSIQSANAAAAETLEDILNPIKKKA